ncbi:MAG: CHASE domain-containing protein [Gammaproteobacteria bacterium]
MQGLFAASKMVSRHEFHAYVQKLDIQDHHPGIQGIGYSEFTESAQRVAHVKRVRDEGFPGYAIKPEGERTEYTAIVYLEPFDWRNRRAFGYDMFSESVRRAAMERARDIGKHAVSSKVTLVQETDEDVQTGFLMYLPVYRNGAATATVGQRRQALRTWKLARARQPFISISVNLKAMDIRLSMDDFGADNALLSHLRRLPIDAVKSDGAFIKQIDASGKPNRRSWEIVRGIIEMAHRLDMLVFAEGVETASQAELLTTLRCDFGQGYYFSPPVEAEQATVMLAVEHDNQQSLRAGMQGAGDCPILIA